jgi:D-hydroxyproline dehydrogenase subunit beta
LPRDGRTVAGWIAEGVYTLLTHSGITLAQFLAESVREELAGGSVEQLNEFRPDRFLATPRG